jgi:uncharacterized damage-inducible protein DinB
MTSSLAQEFIKQSIYYFNINTPRIKACLVELKEDEVWQSPGSASNSIGNLVLHLCGNITQYVISSLGNTEDNRDRDKEFSEKGGYTITMLSDKLSDTVKRATEIIKTLDENALTKNYSVQGFNLSGIGIIIHVTEHYSYHTGQIAFYTKQLRNKDMGFYAGTDLNKKNEV